MHVSSRPIYLPEQVLAMHGITLCPFPRAHGPPAITVASLILALAFQVDYLLISLLFKHCLVLSPMHTARRDATELN